jgi:hypothetical protein
MTAHRLAIAGSAVALIAAAAAPSAASACDCRTGYHHSTYRYAPYRHYPRHVRYVGYRPYYGYGYGYRAPYYGSAYYGERYYSSPVVTRVYYGDWDYAPAWYGPPGYVWYEGGYRWRTHRYWRGRGEWHEGGHGHWDNGRHRGWEDRD